MNSASRFHTRTEPQDMVAVQFDGTWHKVPSGVSLAAALLGVMGGALRQTVSGEERAPYCMMGVCFDCLVDVDGRPNTQACLTPVRDGMIVNRQIGLRGLSQDGGCDL